MSLRRKIVRGALLTGLMLAAVGAAPTAAHAASGGGCGAWNNIDPCISWSANELRADFYMNVNPDYSRCIAVLGIFKNGSLVTQQTFNLNRTGHFGIVTSRTTSSGSAFARVGIYNCDWGWHYSQDSPTVYYRP
jgi:hypothetical protein